MNNEGVRDNGVDITAAVEKPGRELGQELGVHVRRVLKVVVDVNPAMSEAKREQG